MKHSAFLAQLLLEEVDIESTDAESYDQSVLLMRLSDSHSGKVPGAKPSPNPLKTYPESRTANMRSPRPSAAALAVSLSVPL